MSALPCRTVITVTPVPVSHRFGDTAPYWSKIANSYPPHPHSTPSLGVTPSYFGMGVIPPETRMMGLPYAEEITILGRTMWTQCTSVTDWRTDRQTDGQTYRITIIKTVQRIASHGKNDHLHTSLVQTKLNIGLPFTLISTGRTCIHQLSIILSAFLRLHQVSHFIQPFKSQTPWLLPMLFFRNFFSNSLSSGQW